LEFRDKYKDDLNKGVIRNFEFSDEFNRILKNAESSKKAEASVPKKMRTFEESDKSKKTVSSMIVKDNDGKNGKNGKGKKNEQKEGIGLTSVGIVIILLPLILLEISFYNIKTLATFSM
jgi:signal recognition particle receptor subunit alpha